MEVGGLLLLGSLLTLLVYRWGWQAAEAELQAQAADRLQLYSSSLRSAVSRFEYLPFLLAEDPAVRSLLQSTPGWNSTLSDYVSRKLESAAEQARVSLLYVLNSEGLTLASSNHRPPDSLIGNSFRYRPYFQEAIQGRPGFYYAIGTTTGEPGYYLSHPVREADKLLGVSVAKISLEDLQHDWARSREYVLVTDARDVVALANQSQWRYRTLRPLVAAELAEIQQQRQYEGVTLQPLGNELPGDWVQGPRLFQIPEANGEKFLLHSQALEEPGWHIHYLIPATQLRQQAWQRVILVMGSLGLLLLLGLLQRERRQKLTSLQQAKDLLEQRVIERTRELQEAQRELVRSGKLAALGQMSAAVAHELNQPLTAMQTFVASSRLLLQKGKLETVGENLERLGVLVQSVSAIARQLKVFARKSEAPTTLACLNSVLQSSLELFSSQLEASHVTLRLEGWQQERWVSGDALQLQQLFTNLIGNALDALDSVENPQLTIRLETSEAHLQIEFIDNGSGIDPNDLSHLFEPFFTRKLDGQGLGLGLSIADGIAQAHRGRLSASNAPQTGAIFTLELPRPMDSP